MCVRKVPICNAMTTYTRWIRFDISLIQRRPNSTAMLFHRAFTFLPKINENKEKLAATTKLNLPALIIPWLSPTSRFNCRNELFSWFRRVSVNKYGNETISKLTKHEKLCNSPNDPPPLSSFVNLIYQLTYLTYST